MSQTKLNPIDGILSIPLKNDRGTLVCRLISEDDDFSFTLEIALKERSATEAKANTLATALGVTAQIAQSALLLSNGNTDTAAELILAGSSLDAPPSPPWTGHKVIVSPPEDWSPGKSARGFFVFAEELPEVLVDEANRLLERDAGDGIRHVCLVIADAITRKFERVSKALAPVLPVDEVETEEDEEDHAPTWIQPFSADASPLPGQWLPELTRKQFAAAKDIQLSDSSLDWIMLEDMARLKCIRMVLQTAQFEADDAVMASMDLLPGEPIVVFLTFTEDQIDELPTVTINELAQDGPESPFFSQYLGSALQRVIKSLGKPSVQQYHNDLIAHQLVNQLNEMGFFGDHLLYIAIAAKGDLSIAVEGLHSPDLKQEMIKAGRKALSRNIGMVQKLSKGNFLLAIAVFLRVCIETATSHCLFCQDCHPAPTNRLMPCQKELCIFKHEEFGQGISLVSMAQNTPSSLEFHLCCAACAANQHGRADVMEPFPTKLLIKKEERARSGFFGSGTGSADEVRVAHDSSNKDFAALRAILNIVPSVSRIAQCANEQELRRLLHQEIHLAAKHSVEAQRAIDRGGEDVAYLVVRMLVVSCLLDMVELTGEAKIPTFQSAMQFAVLKDVPGREAAFTQACAGKTQFVFHGSASQNWYSIVRNGLRILSGSTYMLHGAAHGNGIYTATDPSTALSYGSPSSPSSVWPGAQIQNMRVVAMCEIVPQTGSGIIVVKQEKHILLRVLIVDSGRGIVGDQRLNHADLALRISSIKSNIDEKTARDRKARQQAALDRAEAERRMKEQAAEASKRRKLAQERDEKDAQMAQQMQLEARVLRGSGVATTAALGSATKRLLSELEKLGKSGADPSISIDPDEDNFLLWRVAIGVDKTEPLGQDLEKWGKKYGKEPAMRLEMIFPASYPFEPPFVRVVEPRLMMHTGHVTIGGSLCMDFLTRSAWSPAHSCESTLVTIKSAMIEGRGRIDFSVNRPYTMAEAKEAFARVARQHGWG